jgi:hypothetical protein
MYWGQSASQGERDFRGNWTAFSDSDILLLT